MTATSDVTEAVAVLAGAMGCQPEQAVLPFPTDADAADHFAVLKAASKRKPPRSTYDRRARQSPVDPATYTRPAPAKPPAPPAAPAVKEPNMLHDIIATVAPGADLTRVIGVAMRLGGIMQDEDPAEGVTLIGELGAADRAALPFVAAAMVDLDKTPSELLAWAGYRPPNSLRSVTGMAPATALLNSDNKRSSRSAECGTNNAWIDHAQRGEPPCKPCQIARAAWERANPSPKGRTRG